ncbi:MAG: aldehyde dehydrogenase [Bacteroidetes bacterium]|nr:aldehyde dehydrogenase [Bacteroidota bacterium]
MDLSFPYYLENYIDGNFIGPLSGKFLDVINPATAEVIAQIPDSDERDVDIAVHAAERAFPAWSQLAVEKKFSILNKIADLIDENLEVLANAETNNNGKPLWLSKRMDIPRASDNFRFYATAIMHFASASHSMGKKGINYTLKQPIGIVGCISPWNLPLYLFTWKIAPALAAGNCVIAKPSEVTPLTAFLLGKICHQAGLPNGVLNILQGSGNRTGENIVKHPKVKAISFTGSTRAGAHIASIAAPMFKKLSLELGGKNASIIFEDCNWQKMMEETIRSSFTNQGQICLCSSRILLHRNIYDQFKNEFLEKVKALKVGDPLEPESRQGAIVSKVHFEKVMQCIEIAKAEGGRILCGGHAIKVEGRCENGYFIEPTVIENLPASCKTNQEEIFGPVVTLQSFETEEEAIALANDSTYGLAAIVWTENISVGHRMAAALEAGIIWVNCWLLRDLRTPFGGMKNSGVGREGGWDALQFFTESKNVCIA